MYHPSAVVMNRGKYAIPWAYDKNKLIDVLRGVPAEDEPRIIRATTKAELLEATEGWKDSDGSYTIRVSTDRGEVVTNACAVVTP